MPRRHSVDDIDLSMRQRPSMRSRVIARLPGDRPMDSNGAVGSQGGKRPAASAYPTVYDHVVGHYMAT